MLGVDFPLKLYDRFELGADKLISMTRFCQFLFDKVLYTEETTSSNVKLLKKN